MKIKSVNNFKKKWMLYLAPVICLIVINLFSKDSTAQSNIPNPDMWISNGTINTIAVDGDYTYIGGIFSCIGPNNTSYGAKLTATSNSPNINYPAVDGDNYSRVNTCVPDGSGGWYIGGWFSTVGSYLRNNIAHINPDGTVDAVWDPNANGQVYSIAISGSDIFAGGSFQTIGGQTRNNIAKLNNTNGDANATWDPNPDNYIVSLAVSGSDVYTGGYFTNIGGQPRNYMAKLNNTDGIADTTWNANSDGQVFSIVINGNNIYAAGQFYNIGGKSRKGIAKLNSSNGNANLTWNANSDGQIFSIVMSGIYIYAGGAFLTIGGQTRNCIAKLDSTSGNADATWNPNSDGGISSVAISGSNIYAGGYFSNIGGQKRNNLAKLNNTNGNADTTWDPNPDNAIFSIAVNGNDIYAGGQFIIIGGLTRNNIARINNLTGKGDASWNPNASRHRLPLFDPSAYVSSIVISGSDIYAGGQFDSIGGQARKNIGKVNNTNGNADATWNPNANDVVNTIAINGNDIYAGGVFQSIGGQTRNNIAKLNNTNGNADATWTPNSDNVIYSIAISTNGSDIYAGGYFTSIGGQTRNNIAKLNNSDGNADTGWDPNPDNAVLSIALSGNDIYTGGYFLSIGGLQKNFIAKLNKTNGYADTLWSPYLTSGVNSIAVSGNYIYMVGYGVIAKLNNVDGYREAWNPGSFGSPSYVQSITTNGPDIYVGGFFTTIGGNIQRDLAMFTDRTLPVSLSSFTYNISDRNVLLKWVTANERNNSGFDIQRSDQKSSTVWTKVGHIAGSGNKNTPTTYTYTDTKLNAGKYQYRLKQIDYNGNFEYHNLSGTVVVGLPTKFNLSQNYPNPFNPSTKIDFTIPLDSKVSLKIYDITGRLMKTLINNELKAAGYYTVVLNGSNFSSGVYFYNIMAGDFFQTKKMLMLK